jgi:hypothetical protein
VRLFFNRTPELEQAVKRVNAIDESGSTYLSICRRRAPRARVAYEERKFRFNGAQLGTIAPCSTTGGWPPLQAPKATIITGIAGFGFFSGSFTVQTAAQRMDLLTETVGDAGAMRRLWEAMANDIKTYESKVNGIFTDLMSSSAGGNKNFCMGGDPSRYVIFPELAADCHNDLYY